ncbi:regulator of rDNA transcription protein 14 [Monosporozyma unispora]|nr:Regulator of rDNA transcription protein 14 [Kazachstania unispora]
MAQLTATQLQANKSVNSLLAKVLPGSQNIKTGSKSKNHTKKGSKAQLIDANLKQRVQLQQRDTLRIKKKQKQAARDKIKHRKLALESLERNAKLQILESHRQKGTLTHREKEYVAKLVKSNVAKVKALDVTQEEKDELKDLQNFILANDNKNTLRSKKRRSKIKQFREDITSSGKKSVVDHRYAGLTPGLAPVGLSDEEESSSEEDDY